MLVSGLLGGLPSAKQLWSASKPYCPRAAGSITPLYYPCRFQQGLITYSGKFSFTKGRYKMALGLFVLLKSFVFFPPSRVVWISRSAHRHKKPCFSAGGVKPLPAGKQGCVGVFGLLLGLFKAWLFVRWSRMLFSGSDPEARGSQGVFPGTRGTNDCFLASGNHGISNKNNAHNFSHTI